MRILLVNNFHYLRGGAERCYFDTGKILEENGHEVAYFSTKDAKNFPGKWSRYFIDGMDLNKTYGLLTNMKAAFRILYNFQAKKQLEKLIAEFKPDLAHLHNIHHHLSPSIIHTLKKGNIPAVMTLHDYKLVSPNYNLYAHGKNYERALGRDYYKCIFDKCIKNSYSASLVCTAEAYLHSWLGIYRQIDAFISPSLYLKEKFRQADFPKTVNYLPNPYCGQSLEIERKAQSSEKYILYFGRLSEEKGVKDLIEAYLKLSTGVKLYITGTGPLEKDLTDLTKTTGPDEKIVFTGYKNGKNLINIIKNAMFVVMPSRWQENAPYSLVEAMALTKCVLCAKMGGFTDIIENGINGFYYEPNNVDDLKDKLEKIINSPNLQEIGENAKKTITELNSSEKYYHGLINLYKSIVMG